jgi:biotin transporter BioY
MLRGYFLTYALSYLVGLLVWWTTGIVWLAVVLGLSAAGMVGLVRGFVRGARGHVEG